MNYCFNNVYFQILFILDISLDIHIEICEECKYILNISHPSLYVQYIPSLPCSRNLLNITLSSLLDTPFTIRLDNCNSSIYLYIYPSIHLPIYPSILLSMYQSSYLSIHTFIYLSISLTFHFSIYLSIYLWKYNSPKVNI